jgi:phosphate transport system ATP-binding protein
LSLCLTPLASPSPQIADLLQALRSRLTIVIVTHNMQQAARISDYTAFFTTDETYIGQMVESGPTNQIFTCPSNPTTIDYIQGNFG